MKKTQKVIDTYKFIESQNMTSDELDRLLSELEGLMESTENKESISLSEYCEDEGSYSHVERENALAVLDNIQ